jgi:hypothetical protein
MPDTPIPEPGPTLDEWVNQLVAETIGQREQILRAFVAQHGCMPDEAIQIEVKRKSGLHVWYVRKMTPAELEARRTQDWTEVEL